MSVANIYQLAVAAEGATVREKAQPAEICEGATRNRLSRR